MRNIIERYSVMFPLLFTTFLFVQETIAEEPPQKFMEVKLIPSDSQVFTGDGLAYKVVITNISRSQITICGPTIKPRYSCVIEMKLPKQDWQQVYEYRDMEMMKAFVPAPIQIPAGATWAEYGQVFLTKGKKPVFGEVGNCELRARINSPIGTYASDSVTIHVKDWPPGEKSPDERFEPYGHLVLDLDRTASQVHAADFADLCKRHASGGIAKTFRLMREVHSLIEKGEVAGKPATRLEAFATLSPGLDEVRRDQLAFLLGNDGIKNKAWKDVEGLLPELKDESNWRRSMRGQLDSAIITGEFRGR